MDKKIIFFELNEVPFRVIDDFCRRRPTSALARTLPLCRQYETISEDETALSPWKTWPSVHRGVNDARHGVMDFGQPLAEADRAYPPLWRLLAERGVSVGVCGSLHSYPMPDSLDHYAFYLPDTFAASPESFPEPLTAFQSFNLEMARASGRNVSSRVPWASALRVLAKAPELGLRMATFGEIGRQLVTERFESWRKARRRTLQVVLAFDIFMKQLERGRPAFATFFTNHVASSMHRFWAAAYPEDYEKVEFTPGWIRTYRDEIDYTMGQFDRFFAALVRFVDGHPDYSLWVTTSMGQAATEAKPLHTQLYCTDISRFMKRLGIPDAAWSRRPAMEPDVCVVVSATNAQGFKSALSRLSIDGKPLSFRETDGFFGMSFGHYDRAQAPVARWGDVDVPFDELGLSDVTIEDNSSTTAYHIPQGALWIYDPSRRPKSAKRTQVSALDLAPSILSNFSVPAPAYMRRATAL